MKVAVPVEGAENVGPLEMVGQIGIRVAGTGAGVGVGVGAP